MADNCIKLLCVLSLFIYSLSCIAQSEKMSIKDHINKIEKMYDVMFVYDSDINLNTDSKTINISKEKELNDILVELFKDTEFIYKQKKGYIILFKKKLHTFSGFVMMDNGEKIINATIYNLTLGTGTVTNEYGFFSMKVPEGKHRIRVSYIGTKELVKEFEIKKDYMETYILYSGIDLDEVIIVKDLNTPLNSTQTGKMSFNSKDLYDGIYLMSTPDMIKKFQEFSGVSQGTELLSGLYVHGGNGYDNRILLDGTPLYHINHIFGLFSAFNTDIIKNVDFYKSGFPARYGGRLSSVIDVRTNSGSYTNYHGQLTFSVLEGRLQFEGPIIKEKSSFNISLRRSLIDLWMLPFNMHKTNKSNSNTTKILYHDFNTKLSSRIKEKAQIEINLYSSNDNVKLDDAFMIPKSNIIDKDKFNMKWGNITASASLRYVFSQRLFSDFTGVYSKNISNYNYDSTIKLDKNKIGIEKRHSNNTTIDNFGYRCEFDYTPNSISRMRFGSNFTHHRFKPQDVIYYSKDSYNPEPKIDISSSKKYYSEEFVLYCEDELKFNNQFKFNAGFHYNAFMTNNKWYHSLEPRLSFNIHINKSTSLKMSLTKMSQNIHLLRGSYLTLPTDCWVPSTDKVTPSKSWQVSCGIYSNIQRHSTFSIELYYKTLSNILEYVGDERLSPTVLDWENNLSKGKGKSYGVGIDYKYRHKKMEVRSSYTLSWSKRFFPEIYNEWYWDQFDNRHKLNVSFHYSFNKKLDFYSLWTLRSGNKFSLPEKYVSSPILPGIDDECVDQFIYGKPNNTSMPLYHRMDLGINIKHKTKNGFEHLLNISVYNAYFMKNAFYINFYMKDDGRFAWKPYSIMPILPSISYTYKF